MTRSIGKKFLALFLALVLLCSLLPQAALPVSAAESDGGSCGENLTWNYYYDEETETGWLSFDGWGDMTDFEPSGAPWYPYRSRIDSVYLPWDLTGVGAYAFQDCTALTDLYLKEEIARVGTGAFSGCSGLTYLSVDNPFCILNCGLSGQPGEMTVSGYAGSTAQAYAEEYGYPFSSIEGSFTRSGSCGIWGDNLTWTYEFESETLVIEGNGEMADFEPGGAGWYPYRAGIRNVNLPEALTSIGTYAFQDCTLLTSAWIPVSVTLVSAGAFSGCTGLETFDVGDTYCALDCGESGLPGVMTVCGFDGSTAEAYAEAYGYAFDSLGSNQYFGSCGENLQWQFDSSSNTLYIEGSGDMHCDYEGGWYPIREHIRSVSVGWEVTSVDWYAFQDCTALTSIALSEGVTRVEGGAFSGCTALESFTVKNPYCELYCGEAGLPGTMTVYGYDGSTAEAYAAEFGYTFSSEGSYYYSGHFSTENSDLNWNFDTGSGILRIYGSGEVTGYQASGWDGEMISWQGEHWEPLREHICALIIEGEITGIDSYAFSYYPVLRSVDLYENVDYVEEGAFSDCSALESFWVSNPYCVLECGLSGSPGTMTVCGYPCSTAAAYAAEYGYAFSPLDGNPYHGECGEGYQWSFDPETGLLSITEVWPPVSCPVMPDYFESDVPWYGLRDYITSVSLPSGITRIGSYAFNNCTALTAVELPDSVSSIGDNAFCGCSALTSVILPQNVVTIEDYAFSNCSGLERFEVHNPSCVISCGESGIPGTMTVYGYFGSTAEDYAEIYGYSFVSISGQQYTGVCGAQGDNLTWTFDVSTGVLTIEGSGDMANYFRTGDTTNAPWSEFGEIITGLSLPENITYIGSWAIYDCRGLTYVSVPGSVTRLNDYALSSRSVRNIWVNEGVTSIDYRALTECTALYSIHLPASLLLIGGDAFNDCESLNDISVAAGNTQFSSSLGILYNKDKTQLIRCPRGIRSSNTVIVPEGVVTICEEAFMDCTHLVSVKIPSSLVEIGTSAFDGCTSLIGLSSDTGIYSLTSIGEKAFLCCSNLRYATIPEGVTTIGTEAFCCCTLLDHLTLPNSVVSIGARAFRGTALRTMTLPASVAYVYSGAIPELNTLTVLNPSCELSCGQSGTPGEMVVYGYADSTAQAYAEQFGYAFCPLDRFTDVNPSAYYAVPVAWAYENGITSGTGSNSFSPNKTCTRAEAVTFLWRAYGSPEPAGTDNPFGDVRPGKYYETAVLWAYHHEPQITGGTSSGKFGVGQSCTRAQVVTFLWAAAGKPEPSITDCVFTDVLETDYFYKAVLWAVDNGITSGTSSTTFSPNAGCTRGQIVTFLYRAIGQD